MASNATKARAQINSSDIFDPEEGTEVVLDMMGTTQSQVQLLNHLQVVSAREFDYEVVTERRRDPESNQIIDFENPGRSLAYEAFMQEPVVISINESTDEKAPPVVYVCVNGDERWFPRGVPIRVQRKFVEILAQSNEKTFKTNKINANDQTDNERPATTKRTQGTPFAVLQDSNRDVKLARRWLLRVTKQGR